MICLIFTLTIDLTWIATYVVGLVFLCISLLAIPGIIGRDETIKEGGWPEYLGQLNKKYLIVSGFNKADNTLYIPVEKIERMELGEGTTEKHGLVLIYVSGRERHLTLVDIIKPKELIQIFNDLNAYNKDEDILKMLYYKQNIFLKMIKCRKKEGMTYGTTETQFNHG